MYKVGEIFGINDEYTERAMFCNENHLCIEEITKDTDTERKFQIQELPKKTDDEILEEEIKDLKLWLDTYYARHEQKYRRLKTLGILTDEGKDPYNELINLYNEAEIKRARIQELERLLSDSTK